jgi:hypothetical protein
MVSEGLGRTPRCSDFLAPGVRDFVEHVTDAARVDHIGRRDFVDQLPTPATQPNINSFFERELRLAGGVVLNDACTQARILSWLWRSRKRLR